MRYAIRVAMQLNIPLKNVISMEIRKHRNREVGGGRYLIVILENLSGATVEIGTVIWDSDLFDFVFLFLYN